MVIVRGMYEITELVAGCIGSVGLYMAGCNVVPLRYVPDFPAALFVLSSAIIIHHIRVVHYPPVQKLWRLLLELVGLYIATQITVAIIWETFHALVDFSRDSVLNTSLGLVFLKHYPKLILILRQDVCYIAQLAISVLVTIKAIGYTSAMDYILPERRLYQYYEGQATDDFYSFNRESTASQRRVR